MKCRRVLSIVTGGTLGMKKDLKTGSLVPTYGFVKDKIRKNLTLNDQQYVDEYTTTNFVQEKDKRNYFAFPKSLDNNTRLLYYINEYENPVNSSDMDLTYYYQLADTISENYDKYDGFVITHGTDTMCYTASYLSFIFENLGKPVVLTGAHIPLCDLRTDAYTNMQASIYVAGYFPMLPEVSICFDNKLYRGNRTTKFDCESFSPYLSPNFDLMLDLAKNPIIAPKNSIPRSGKFKILKNLSPNIIFLPLFPGISAECVRSIIRPEVEGVVLQSYGLGNGPSNNKALLNVLKQASDKGVLILNCTQCAKGSVKDEVGNALYDAGAVPGYDVTPNAAIAKLSSVAGLKTMTTVDKKMLLRTNMRGEITK